MTVYKNFEINKLRKAYGEMLNSLVEQVETNQFNTYNRKNFTMAGFEETLTASSGYRKLGPKQIANWKIPPFAGNPGFILATYKFRFRGTPIGSINITVGDVTTPAVEFTQDRIDALYKPFDDLVAKLQVV